MLVSLSPELPRPSPLCSCSRPSWLCTFHILSSLCFINLFSPVLTMMCAPCPSVSLCPSQKLAKENFCSSSLLPGGWEPLRLLFSPWFPPTPTPGLPSGKLSQVSSEVSLISQHSDTTQVPFLITSQKAKETLQFQSKRLIQPTGTADWPSPSPASSPSGHLPQAQ